MPAPVLSRSQGTLTGALPPEPEHRRAGTAVWLIAVNGRHLPPLEAAKCGNNRATPSTFRVRNGSRAARPAQAVSDRGAPSGPGPRAPRHAARSRRPQRQRERGSPSAAATAAPWGREDRVPPPLLPVSPTHPEVGPQAGGLGDLL